MHYLIIIESQLLSEMLYVFDSYLIAKLSTMCFKNKESEVQRNDFFRVPVLCTQQRQSLNPSSPAPQSGLLVSVLLSSTDSDC